LTTMLTSPPSNSSAISPPATANTSATTPSSRSPNSSFRHVDI
jgi:hypothetical protein